MVESEPGCLATSVHGAETCLAVTEKRLESVWLGGSPAPAVAPAFQVASREGPACHTLSQAGSTGELPCSISGWLGGDQGLSKFLAPLAVNVFHFPYFLQRSQGKPVSDGH